MHFETNENLAPWYDEGLDGPVKLCVTLDLAAEDTYILPVRKDALCAGASVLVWDVPAALSLDGRRRISQVINDEVAVLRNGWRMGENGVPAFDEAAEKARKELDEFFGIVRRLPKIFTDAVRSARQIVSDVGEGGVRNLVAAEGEPCLAAVVLQERYNQSRIRVFGDLEDAISKASCKDLAI